MSSATGAPEHKPAAVKCIHHWDLGLPRAEIVHGICRKCGAEHDYPSDPHEWNCHFWHMRPGKLTQST